MSQYATYEPLTTPTPCQTRMVVLKAGPTTYRLCGREATELRITGDGRGVAICPRCKAMSTPKPAPLSWT